MFLGVLANIDGQLVKVYTKSKLILFSFFTHIPGLIVNDSPVYIRENAKKNNVLASEITFLFA